MRVGEKVIEGIPGVGLQQASCNIANFGITWNVLRHIDQNVYRWLSSSNRKDKFIVFFV